MTWITLNEVIATAEEPDKPETWSEYNQGWNDACDYIREIFEQTEK